ncbi:MAG: ParB/RepB/Spo0J family partition protein [Deltaproteobacteria bacterium]|nr:ParB/RepB/Spo0J family partition protein [Deltaproteobacteria bacterium]
MKPAPPPMGAPRTGLVKAGIEEIHPSPEQPRRAFDEVRLDELAASIRVHGVIQPLVVRARQGGGFFLIAGERRWRAAQRAGLTELPIVIKDATPAQSFELAMIENLQRADLNAIEEAEGYARLHDDFGLTQEQIAEQVGKDRSTVANAMRLLKLPELVRGQVVEGLLSMGHARALLGLEGMPGGVAAMERAAREVIARGLSVRQTEALVKKLRTPAAAAAPTPEGDKKSASVKDLELRLTRALGSRVAITDQGGKGSVQIAYGSLDELDRLIERFLADSHA